MRGDGETYVGAPFAICTPSQHPIHALWLADSHVEVRHQAIGKRINPPMNAEVLGTLPGLPHENIRCDIPHLTDDVEFAQTVEASAEIRDRVKLMAVLVADLSE